MHRSDCDYLTHFFFSRWKVNMKSLMNTVTLNMIVTLFIVTNNYLERMLLLLNSVYGRGLKHAVHEGILCGPRCFLGILK